MQINEMRVEEVGTALVRSLNENDAPEREKGALKNDLTKRIFGGKASLGMVEILSMIAGASKGGEIADSGKRWKEMQSRAND